MRNSRGKSLCVNCGEIDTENTTNKTRSEVIEENKLIKKSPVQAIKTDDEFEDDDFAEIEEETQLPVTKPKLTTGAEKVKEASSASKNTQKKVTLPSHYISDPKFDSNTGVKRATLVGNSEVKINNSHEE
jgi:hypothetical protein